MDIPDLVERLKRSEKKMSDDYYNSREGNYPPLYSKDYLFGKLKMVRELLDFIKWSK